MRVRKGEKRKNGKGRRNRPPEAREDVGQAKRGGEKQAPVLMANGCLSRVCRFWGWRTDRVMVYFRCTVPNRWNRHTTWSAAENAGARREYYVGHSIASKGALGPIQSHRLYQKF